MLIEHVAELHGVFTLLWHNTYMDGENLKIYKRFLQFCREKEAWMTNGWDIIDNNMK